MAKNRGFPKRLKWIYHSTTTTPIVFILSKIFMAKSRSVGHDSVSRNWILLCCVDEYSSVEFAKFDCVCLNFLIFCFYFCFIFVFIVFFYLSTICLFNNVTKMYNALCNSSSIRINCKLSSIGLSWFAFSKHRVHFNRSDRQFYIKLYYFR